MPRVCDVTGKKPMIGNNVSHANNKTKRRFLPNLHKRRFWVESENRWVSLRVSNAGLRTIDRKGIDVVLADLREQGMRDLAAAIEEPTPEARGRQRGRKRRVDDDEYDDEE